MLRRMCAYSEIANIRSVILCRRQPHGPYAGEVMVMGPPKKLTIFFAFLVENFCHIRVDSFSFLYYFFRVLILFYFSLDMQFYRDAGRLPSDRPTPCPCMTRPCSPWAGEFGRVIRNICYHSVYPYGHLNFL